MVVFVSLHRFYIISLLGSIRVNASVRGRITVRVVVMATGALHFFTQGRQPRQDPSVSVSQQLKRQSLSSVCWVWCCSVVLSSNARSAERSTALLAHEPLTHKIPVQLRTRSIQQRLTILLFY